MGFKPIMTGMFNAMAVNRKFREIWAAIDEIKGFEEASQPAEVVAETETADSAETITREFDYEMEDDCAALKKWAFEVHGRTIKGNKKAETIREEIREFLTEG